MSKKKEIEICNFETVIGMIKKANKNSQIQIASGDGIKEVIELKDCIDTGSIKLNQDLGGGIPRGRIVEVYGLEASGKSTLALEMIKNETILGKKCALFDVECAHNYEYLRDLGVDMDNLMLVRPTNAEQTWEAIEICVKSGTFSLVVLDSLAAMLPRAVEEKGIEGDTMARLASLNTKAIGIINPYLGLSNTTLMLINQVRQGLDMYGPKETTPGGNIIKFMSSVRIRIKRKDYLKHDDQLIGQVSRYQVIKNKVAAPGKEGDLSILFGKGFDRQSDLAEFLLENPEYGIAQSGSWVSKDGTSITQGKPRFIELLREDTALYEELRGRVNGLPN